jgi:inhibitor of KinA
MIIKPYGNQAMLVEFEAIIDPLVHQQVTQLYRALSEASLKGIKALIPAYNSLTICYEPSLFSIETLSQEITSLIDHKLRTPSSSKTLHIPVCYDPSFALDLDFLLEQTQLSKERFIELHSTKCIKCICLAFCLVLLIWGKFRKNFSVIEKNIHA